jgi:Xaa-Pro aminopeptidase
MEEKQLDLFIVPSTDAHMSEYPPKHWESENGSAALPVPLEWTAVVSQKDKAGVWTDSRYFLQAADELKDTGFEIV